MAAMNTVVEGNVKFRDGRKWKKRWCVLKKPSPVADCLIVNLYRDVKESIKSGHLKTSFHLEEFYGLESGICYDNETSVLAIICQKVITLLAFESRDTLIQFEIKIRGSLVEEHQFPVRTVKVPSHSKLPLDLLRMHICGHKFCLTGHIPPKILGSWQVSELRRFGAIHGKFCFEGGSRCGKGQGFHVLQTDQVQEISDIISHASIWKSSPLIRKQSGKRRSEFLDAKHEMNYNEFRQFQNTQKLSGHHYQEDNSWPCFKRHSISVTDYRHTKSYKDKQRLQSIENVEKERLMIIYDVPPRRIRKVEFVENHNENNNNIREYDISHDAIRNINGNTSSQGLDNYINWTKEFNSNVMLYQVPVSSSNQLDIATSISNQLESCSSHEHLQSGQSVDVSSHVILSPVPVLCHYNSPLFSNNDNGQSSMNSYPRYSRSVPSQITQESEHFSDEDGYDEVLKQLNQSQQNLEKEMSLLDEMLEIYQQHEGGNVDGSSQKPPPLPVKLSQQRDVGGSLLHGDAHHSLDNISISSDNTHCRPIPRSGHTTSLRSPNLLKKLNQIPKRSKFSAPLPHVNLSKYDIGDVDNNYMHIPAASSSPPVECSTSHNKHKFRSKGYDHVQADSNKENLRISVSLPGSRENLECINVSDSHSEQRARNNSLPNEPIYANEQFESSLELPLKGGMLSQKLKQMPAQINPKPPQLPDRHHLSKQSFGQCSSHISPSVSLNSSQQDYFLIGNFEQEPKHDRRNFTESHCLNESLQGQTIITLLSKDQSSVKLEESGCYMDMTGICDLEHSKSLLSELENNRSLDKTCGNLPRPKYHHSFSASEICSSPANFSCRVNTQLSLDSENACSGNSFTETMQETVIKGDNYILMASASPTRPPVIDNLVNMQDCVNSTQLCDRDFVRIKSDNVSKQTFGANESVESIEDAYVDESQKHDSSKHKGSLTLEMPFDNLIVFTKPSDNQMMGKCVKVTVKKSESFKEGKYAGFFSHLIRRNSKDRKAIFQSHENLLSSVHSEPLIRENLNSSDSSSSGASSNSHSQVDLVFRQNNRNRSSSFPNRSSYVAMNDSSSSSSTGLSALSQQSDLCATNSSLNSSETVSTKASSNECHIDENLGSNENVLSDSEKEMFKINYDKYNYGEHMQNNQTDTRNSAERRDDIQSMDKADSNEIDTSEHVEEFQKFASEGNVSCKVFTSMCYQDGSFTKNTCKTDDEKLLELWHSTQSLHSDRFDKIADLKSKLTLPLNELSPDEKANAIARHISSLPPFIPPKMKCYPTKLSPVLEKTTSKKEKPELLNVSSQTESDCDARMSSPILSPSLMKQKAKSILRITPPSEDEHGKIWILRTHQNTIEQTDQIPEDTKHSTLVVDVDGADQLSISSLDSFSHGETVVRSSPAATILRPRSGKEYQKIERRRTHDGSITVSPITTPKSSASESVFTFDTFSSSVNSAMSCHGDSSSRNVHSEQTSICTSAGSDILQSPTALYMNIDYNNTPPDSPMLLPVTPLPAENMEPQLNYAKIDLSEMGSGSNTSHSKKFNYAEMDVYLPERFASLWSPKKSVKTPEPIVIEYTMIDMVATKAALKARKEHAQSRDGSEWRARNTLPSSASFSTKERMASLSTKLECKQSAVANTDQGSSFVSSTTF